MPEFTPQTALMHVYNIVRQHKGTAEEHEALKSAFDIIVARMNRAHELEQASVQPANGVQPAQPANDIAAQVS